MSDVPAFAGAAVSTVLLTAGIGKLANPAAFRFALAGYRRFPEASLSAITFLVPVAELTCAILLWIPTFQRLAALATLGLLLAFTGLLLVALFQGREVDCGCFGGTGSEPVSWETLVRNGVLIALTLGVALAARTKPLYLPSVLAGLGIGFVVLTMDQAINVFRRHWIRPEEVRR